MVIQYPHTAKVFEATDSALVNGNWTESSLQLTYESRSRIEAASSNQYVTGQNGERITFHSVVYLPLPKIITTGPTPPSSEPETIIYQGEMVLWKVPAELDGEEEVNIPALSGQLFNLRMDSRPLEEETEFENTGSGFRLIGTSGKLITGQRYEATKYYVFQKKYGNSGISVGSDFLIKPGSLFEVWVGNVLKVRDTVKQFSLGQLNMRVWL
ncbi:MAG: hypothetical protein J7527_14670 [Chitinophagaceae bacterium]|nr:hypothetical protein [Chitinophagaceae bacterium]